MKKSMVLVTPNLFSVKNFRGDLLLRLRETYQRIYVISNGRDVDIEKWLAVNRINYVYLDFNNAKIEPLKDIAVIRKYLLLISNIQPDLVLAITLKPILYSSLVYTKVVNIFTGLGYVFTSNTAKAKIIRKIIRGMVKRANRRAHCTFVQNDEDYRVIRNNNLIDKSEKLYKMNGSGVNLQRFHRRIEHPCGNQSFTTFIFVGRLLRGKGVIEYIEAARRCHSRYGRKVRCKILGRYDPENVDCISEKVFASMQAVDYLDYRGVSVDVIKEYEESDVFVLPSYREGVSRSILEAMALSMPIITTSAPGCGETVQDGVNGFVTPVADIDAIVKAMVYFIEQPQSVYSFGEASLKIARELYDVHKVNEYVISKIA